MTRAQEPEPSGAIWSHLEGQTDSRWDLLRSGYSHRRNAAGAEREVELNTLARPLLPASLLPVPPISQTD